MREIQNWKGEKSESSENTPGLSVYICGHEKAGGTKATAIEISFSCALTEACTEICNVIKTPA